MKNNNFFYLQYNKINWENQDKTKINSLVNENIIHKIILKKKDFRIRVFDIGFGIGLFVKMLYDDLKKKYEKIIIEGCEPSEKNYHYFEKSKIFNNHNFRFYNSTFQDVKSNNKFDFITAIYVFPHFASEDLEDSAKKIHSMLDINGQFILVVADENYLKQKLKEKKDLFIEENVISLDNKEYKEFLHYSDIPKIGKVIDYNREEAFYVELFKKNGFVLDKKENLDDHGFICTIFVFEKR